MKIFSQWCCHWHAGDVAASAQAQAEAAPPYGVTGSNNSDVVA
jgi:hypothetical protein